VGSTIRARRLFRTLVRLLRASRPRRIAQRNNRRSEAGQSPRHRAAPTRNMLGALAFASKAALAASAFPLRIRKKISDRLFDQPFIRRREAILAQGGWIDPATGLAFEMLDLAGFVGADEGVQAEADGGVVVLGRLPGGRWGGRRWRVLRAARGRGIVRAFPPPPAFRRGIPSSRPAYPRSCAGRPGLFGRGRRWRWRRQRSSFGVGF
jgi:hypothetical protein